MENNELLVTDKDFSVVFFKFVYVKMNSKEMTRNMWKELENKRYPFGIKLGILWFSTAWPLELS